MLKVDGLVLVVFGLMAAASSAAEPEPVRSIAVEGNGSVQAEPDLGHVTLGVVTEDRASDAAIAANASAMAGVYRALAALGVERKDVRTVDYDVVERREGDGDRARRVGFVATNLVRVTIRDLENMGKAIDALSAKGANVVRGIGFGNASAEEYVAEARRKAAFDARAKAQTIADALGVTLGAPARVTESVRRPWHPEPMIMRSAMASPAATEVSGGSLEYTVSINVTWDIVPTK